MCSYVANGAVETAVNESLPLDVWERFVDDVAAWRPYLWLTGGEPTLYPYLVPLIRRIKGRGLICGMTTNGTTLEHLAEELVAAGLDVLVVSLDGRENVHNRVRGHPKAFQRAEAGIRRLHQARAQRKRRKPLLIGNCSLSPDNYRDAEEMVTLAHELGLDALGFQHLWMITPEMVDLHNSRWGTEHAVAAERWATSERIAMDPAEVADVVHRTRRLASPLAVRWYPDLEPSEVFTYYEQPPTFVRRQPAYCAWLNTDILPNGDVSPCFDLVCGNITQEPLTAIWNNESFRRHRQRLATDGDFPICVRCCSYWRRG